MNKWSSLNIKDSVVSPSYLKLDLLFCSCKSPKYLELKNGKYHKHWPLLTKNRFNASEAATRGVLKNFVKLTRKHLRRSLFFNEVAGLRPYFKRKTPAQLLSCEFCKIFKNIFLTEYHKWLLLTLSLSKILASNWLKKWNKNENKKISMKVSKYVMNWK